MNKNQSKYFYTASLMNEALLKLLEEKDFEYITVKEICLKAGVSRSTFYLHYETIEDLVIETVEKVNKEFNNYFADVDKSDLTSKILTREDFLYPYLNYIKEHKKVYLLREENAHLFKDNKEAKLLYETIFDKALTNFGVDENEKEYIFSFYCYGVLALIRRWIKDECNTPIEKIVELIIRLTAKNE